MIQRSAHALLVCKDHEASYLSDSLARRGWVCDVAPSFEIACQLFGIVKFDLVLSEVRLLQASTNPLLRLLTDSEGSMFVSHGVEAGCWWLPVLRRGRFCWGEPALRPVELTRVLNELRGEALKGTLETAGTPFSCAAVG